MFFRLFLAFTLIPVVEIYLLIQLGSKIGVMMTIGIVVATGVIGAYLARTQGLLTVLKMQKTLQAGQIPAEEMIDAVLIALAGVVLLTPGFITDVMGMILLFPVTRRMLKHWLIKKWQRVQVQTNQYQTMKNFHSSKNTSEEEPTIIEGSYTISDTNEKP